MAAWIALDARYDPSSQGGRVEFPPLHLLLMQGDDPPPSTGRSRSEGPPPEGERREVSGEERMKRKSFPPPPAGKNIPKEAADGEFNPRKPLGMFEHSSVSLPAGKKSTEDSGGGECSPSTPVSIPTRGGATSLSPIPSPGREEKKRDEGSGPCGTDPGDSRPSPPLVVPETPSLSTGNRGGSGMQLWAEGSGDKCLSPSLVAPVTNTPAPSSGGRDKACRQEEGEYLPPSVHWSNPNALSPTTGGEQREDSEEGEHLPPSVHRSSPNALPPATGGEQREDPVEGEHLPPSVRLSCPNALPPATGGEQREDPQEGEHLPPSMHLSHPNVLSPITGGKRRDSGGWTPCGEDHPPPTFPPVPHTLPRVGGVKEPVFQPSSPFLPARLSGLPVSTKIDTGMEVLDGLVGEGTWKQLAQALAGEGVRGGGGLEVVGIDHSRSQPLTRLVPSVITLWAKSPSKWVSVTLPITLAVTPHSPLQEPTDSGGWGGGMKGNPGGVFPRSFWGPP